MEDCWHNGRFVLSQTVGLSHHTMDLMVISVSDFLTDFSFSSLSFHGIIHICIFNFLHLFNLSFHALTIHFHLPTILELIILYFLLLPVYYSLSCNSISKTILCLSNLP